MRILHLATFLLGVVGALASPAFAEDDDTDFVCWDMDNGETECADIDEFTSMCEGIEDWDICKDVLGMEGSPNYTPSPAPAVMELALPRRHVAVPRGPVQIATPEVRPTRRY